MLVELVDVEVVVPVVGVGVLALLESVEVDVEVEVEVVEAETEVETDSVAPLGADVETLVSSAPAGTPAEKTTEVAASDRALPPLSASASSPPAAIAISTARTDRARRTRLTRTPWRCEMV